MANGRKTPKDWANEAAIKHCLHYGAECTIADIVAAALAYSPCGTCAYKGGRDDDNYDEMCVECRFFYGDRYAEIWEAEE